MGQARFDYYGAARILNLRKYQGRLSYLPIKLDDTPVGALENKDELRTKLDAALNMKTTPAGWKVGALY